MEDVFKELVEEGVYTREEAEEHLAKMIFLNYEEKFAQASEEYRDECLESLRKNMPYVGDYLKREGLYKGRTMVDKTKVMDWIKRYVEQVYYLDD